MEGRDYDEEKFEFEYFKYDKNGEEKLDLDEYVIKFRQ